MKKAKTDEVKITYTNHGAFPCVVWIARPDVERVAAGLRGMPHVTDVAVHDEVLT